MINTENCKITDWLSKGLTDEEIEQIKKDALKEAKQELQEIYKN